MHTHARSRANTVVCANGSTGLLAACFLPVLGLALDVCFFFFFYLVQFSQSMLPLKDSWLLSK